MCSLACGCACGALLALAFVLAFALARGCRRRSPALAVKTRLAEVLIPLGPRARAAPAPLAQTAVAFVRPPPRRESCSLLGAPPPPPPPPAPSHTYKGVPKLPLPEHWLNKPFSKYSTDIPRPLAASNLKPEPEVKAKQFSVTRSPSLENDKSPFVVKGEVFMFNTGKDMSEDMPRDEDGGSNLRRYQSVSTRLNMCSETFDEKQNSPKECSSSKENTSVSKFDFSPKLLADSLTSPRYFTPPETVSPAFFAEPSPRSVYYDTVRSPKFFAETPRPDDVISPLASPRTLLDHQNRNNGEKPGSPRVLSAKPKSPKVYSYNKENYFTFDNVHVVEENDSRLSPRPRRYLGRNSIEKERFTPPADKEIRKYKRHHSCDTSYKNIEINVPKTENNNVETETVHKEIDVVDCCAKMEAVDIESNSETEKTELLNPCQSTAQMRRQRLKSISLDSDNAKIIEQNLGLPIAKQLKEQMNEAYKKQEVSTSCDIPTTPEERPAFKFEEDKTKSPEGDPKTPELLQKKTLRQSSDTQSFIDMPRFSPKEFEITVTSEEGATTSAEFHSKKKGKNLRNLTIDLTKRDSDLEKELLEFEKLYTDAEEKKVKTPTLKVKATSLDSSESVNLSLPQKKTLDVPQNSISVPNTPKRQLKRILAQKSSLKHDYSGSKLTERRLYMKGQDSGIFLRENHASLMLYQPGTSRVGSRTMGSFDEDMVDVPPEINISGAEQKYHETQSLGSNLLNYKPNLSVSSTNLKTLPEGVPSDDFETSIEDEKFGKKLHRRNSNQSMMMSLDGKYSTHSLQSSNCSLSSSGTSCHNLASVRTSVSNFSLNTDNRQKKLSLERRDSNASMMVNVEHLTPTTRVMCSSNTSLVGESSKNCLLQRRGSNNSLTLNITTNLSRHASNSSLNKDPKIGQKKGLLERRSSNTSLTLNINNSNPQLSVNRGLSISNYNLNGSTCNLSRYNSNQSIDNQTHEPKKGILERRSSNTSLTLNITQEPRELEIDETVLERTVNEPQHRKSLSTENLIPKSYKIKTTENNKTFGSHDNLWSNSYQEPRNLTYVCGDQENEIIYALGTAEQSYPRQGFVRNITTKPLSPQSTSEDFRLYLANMQHLQNASSVLTRRRLRDLNNVFQNGYSKVKCVGSADAQPCCSGVVDLGGASSSEPQPCSEYQKILLRNLHQEFWDMPTNFQEKPIVSGASLKNRYRSILPNEHSRVILEKGATDAEGYINANFIKGHEYTRNCYVATQGPLQNTTYDFWRMVHQNHDAARPRTQVDRTRTEAGRTRTEAERTRVEVDRTRVEAERTYLEENKFRIEMERTKLESEITRTESVRTRFESQMTIEAERTRLQSDRRVPLSLKLEPVGTENEPGSSGPFWDPAKTEPHRTGPESDSTRTEPEMIALNLDRTEPEHEGVQKVVMLTNFIENNRQKCEKYFPLELNEELTFYNTDAPDTNFFSDNTESEKSRYVIKNCGVLQKPGYTIRKLKVTHIPSESESESVFIYHYWFNNWADHKCPKDVNALLNLSLDVLKDTPYDFSNKEEKVDTKCKCGDSPREARFVFPSDSKNSLCESDTALSTCLDFSAESKSPPIIIHCSAGIGRTGCLIAILNGIKQLSSDQKVDILGIVCNMRLNRGGMVQSSEQYELVHKVLCLFEEACLPKME